jgi:hypothetical protein
VSLLSFFDSPRVFGRFTRVVVANQEINSISSENTETPSFADGNSAMSPVGLEPTTHGLKVRCSTN